MTVSRGRLAAAAALALAAALVAAVLLLQHYGEPRAVAAAEQACGPGSGCETVARSAYSRFAGLPLAAWGLVFYSSVALLLALGVLAEAEVRAWAAGAAFWLLAAALVLDLVLLALQAFVIHAFCVLCLSSYVLGGLALALLLPARRAALRPPVAAPEGRVLLAGWALATLVVFAGTVTARAGLAARERVRATTMLGSAPERDPAAAASAAATPLPPLPTPGPATGGSTGTGSELEQYREAARAAQEQARRLQETLDDPKKLDQYFSDKAAREFEQGPVQRLDLEGIPRKGPAEAPVKVVEFSDFLCPYCRSLAAAFGAFLPQTGGKMALHFKNYPLDKECNPNIPNTIHPGACWLALGAVCAQEQGRFWEYHDKVFSGELHEPKGPDVVRLAVEAGLDQSAMESCLVADRTRQKLAAQVAEAKRVGVQATPTVFIDGKRLPRVNDFLAMADKEAARLGLPPVPTQQN